jgi:hypothetical protein
MASLRSFATRIHQTVVSRTAVAASWASSSSGTGTLLKPSPPTNLFWQATRTFASQKVRNATLRYATSNQPNSHVLRVPSCKEVVYPYGMESFDSEGEACHISIVGSRSVEGNPTCLRCGLHSCNLPFVEPHCAALRLSVM